MKIIITSILAIILISNSLIAQQTTTTTPTSATATKATYSLTVVVAGVNNRSGKLYVGLANSAESFTKESIQNKSIDVPASGEITLTFDSLTAGRYAVRLYQDLNGNGKMDFAGQMPSEPFGFSNVAMLMGRPDFDQSSFELNENKSIRIRVLEM